MFSILKDGIQFIKYTPSANENIAVRSFDSNFVTSSNNDGHYCVCIHKVNGLMMYLVPTALFTAFIVISALIIDRIRKMTL